MYFRNSTHSGGAFFEQAYPSPPPIWVVWSPAPPATDGNGNQPRNAGCFLSGVRLPIVPPSQAPISSIAALPLATRPAELFGPTWPGVARESGWYGLVALNACRS